MPPAWGPSLPHPTPTPHLQLRYLRLPRAGGSAPFPSQKSLLTSGPGWAAEPEFASCCSPRSPSGCLRWVITAPAGACASAPDEEWAVITALFPILLMPRCFVPPKPSVLAAQPPAARVAGSPVHRTPQGLSHHQSTIFSSWRSCRMGSLCSTEGEELKAGAPAPPPNQPQWRAHLSHWQRGKTVGKSTQGGTGTQGKSCLSHPHREQSVITYHSSALSLSLASGLNTCRNCSSENSGLSRLFVKEKQMFITRHWGMAQWLA